MTRLAILRAALSDEYAALVAAREVHAEACAAAVPDLALVAEAAREVARRRGLVRRMGHTLARAERESRRAA